MRTFWSVRFIFIVLNIILAVLFVYVFIRALKYRPKFYFDSEALAKRKMTYAFDAIGVEDRFTETGPYDELLATYGLSAESIADRVMKLLNK